MSRGHSNFGSVVLALAVIAACLAGCDLNRGAAKSAGPLRVHVFSKTSGFRHDSIAAGRAAIERLGAEHHFEVELAEDADIFTDDRLNACAVIVFLNTTGDVLNESQQAAMERFIRRGGGFVGIHSAADTEYGWPWYGRLVGAYFKSHPEVQMAEVVVESSSHVSTRHLPPRWSRRDEWYNYRLRPGDGVQVLLALDTSSYSGSEMGGSHPIAWCHEFDGGRAWYTGGGHTIESFGEPHFLQHILGGIMWAAGREPSSTER